MTALLHFDKLFQIPLILAHGISGVAYRDMIEAFMAADPKRFPMIAGINAFFEGEARSIQVIEELLGETAEYAGRSILRG